MLARLWIAFLPDAEEARIQRLSAPRSLVLIELTKPRPRPLTPTWTAQPDPRTSRFATGQGLVIRW